MNVFKCFIVGGQSCRSRSHCGQEDATGLLHDFYLSSGTLVIFLSLEGVAPKTGVMLSLGGGVYGLTNLGKKNSANVAKLPERNLTIKIPILFSGHYFALLFCLKYSSREAGFLAG